MKSDLRNSLETVLKEKEEKIIPSNIRKGVTIFDIEGTLDGGIDTSDGTATTEDILEGKIAYVNNEQLTGTMVNNGTLEYEALETSQEIPKGYTDGGTVKAVDITTLNEYQACLTLANSIDNLDDYSDTTATSADIALGKTAYSNGELITGTAEGIDNNGYYEATGGNTFKVQSALCIIDFKNIDMTGVTSLASCFTGSGVKIVKNLDTSNITNMNSTFSGCTRLTTIPELNTSNVTDLAYCFQDCSSLTTIGTLDTSKVTNMLYLFAACSALIEISKLDTSKVTAMSSMFSGCKKLEVIPEFDYSSTLNVSSMFAGCTNLKEIKGTLMNCSKATGTDYTFSQCSALEILPEIDFSASTRCYCTFQSCSSLKYVKIKLSSTVKNTQWMFDNCVSLETVESSEDVIDLSGCTSVQQMFRNCPKLKNIPQFNLPNVTNISGMLYSLELTDESLNNIMASCITATKVSSKTLKNIGLTSDQATTCQSLSNYEAFINAGWTTGY